MTSRYVVGCMTGTSMDGIDAALVRIDGQGLAMRAEIERTASHPLGPLASPLRDLAAGTPATAANLAGLARDLALAHITAIQPLIQGKHIGLIAVHGQTVYHAPPVSWQLINPTPIADAFHSPVVFDLRAADLAAGGQGAPITPLADYVMFRANAARVVINLGGFANYTLLPASADPSGSDHEFAIARIRGGDICACNQLLDAIARKLFGTPYDVGGQRAAAGVAVSELRESLVAILGEQARAGRSLGTGDEVADWIDMHRASAAAENLARTASEAIATVITDTVQAVSGGHGVGPIDRILLAGGGVENSALVDALARHSRASVQRTDDFGVHARCREAAAIAVLGVLCQDRVPITLPQVTGVRQPAPVAGVWAFPGGVSR